MKKLILLAFVLLLCSCGPSRHAIHLEMRHPSRSGIELAGKIIAVVYQSGGDNKADTFNENMAVSFAKTLEKDYQTGEGSVGLYCVDSTIGDYSQKDSLQNLVIATGSDVVFLFDVPQLGVSSSGSVPLKVKLYCYDSMNKEDKVLEFSGSTVVADSSESTLQSEAADAGRRVADNFVSQWKHEQFSIAYYDSQKWYEGLVRADQYDWKGAMDIWFTLLDTNDMMKRACAEYNIAVACYLMGDMALATEWLNKSVADNEMPTLTDALRKRIEARK